MSAAGISKKLGETEALKNVSADFTGAMIHCVLGPNGAGKTTFMRLLAGLLRPDAGKISWNRGGLPVDFQSVKPELAYFPQEPSLYPDLTCGEHLAFFRDLYGVPKKIYDEKSEMLLRLARLSEFRDRKAGQLSGGMYKKLGLICVLLHSPSALLLDEPTVGVDPVSRRELWELMHGLSAGGMLVIMTTSYMDDAQRCSRAHLLDGGRFILSGEPRAILENEKASGFEEIFLRLAK